MLASDQRTLYTQCLTAPDGYRFDGGVATTFTLNLETLLILPFTLATQRQDDPEGLILDPVALLEGIRETSDRLAVFCHEGYIAVPPREQLLYGLLEDCVIPVAALDPEKGIFHPKLWLLRFVSDDSERPLLRAVVLSRNLTFDRSWDTALVLEGEVRGKPSRSSYGLSELLGGLPTLAKGKLDEGRVLLIEELAAQARHTSFEAPEPFVGRARFHAIGTATGARFNPQPDADCQRVLCVSPFLSTRAVQDAASLATTGDAERILISREDQLNAIKSTALAKWDQVYILADEAESDETADMDAELADGLTRMSPPTGLHAKVVVAEFGDRRSVDARWWVGSANLSEAAWSGQNVELMVELDGKHKLHRGEPVGAGIDAFLHSGFSKLLTEYVRSDPDPDAVAKEKALDLADDVRRLVASAKLQLRAQGSDDQFDLTLTGDVELPSNTNVVVWPVTLSESTHTRPFPGRGDQNVSWPALAAASLTAMVAFSVTARYQTASATIRFAIKVEATGFPDDRHARIVRQIINTQDGFFRYLRMLLSDKSDPLESAMPVGGTSGTEGAALSFMTGDAVLEDLLRTLSRDPERLDAVDRLIRDLCETDEGKALIPPDFMTLWRTLQGFRGELHE